MRASSKRPAYPEARHRRHQPVEDPPRGGVHVAEPPDHAVVVGGVSENVTVEARSADVLTQTAQVATNFKQD